MGLFGKNIVWRPHKMHCDFITFILTPNVTFQTISLCSDGRLVLKISAFELGILPRVPEIFSHTWWDITCIWVDQRPKTYANMGYCKTWLKGPKTAHENSLTPRVLEPTSQPPDHPECKDLVVADRRRSLTTVDPQVVYFDKRFWLIYFLEDNLLDVFLW